MNFDQGFALIIGVGSYAYNPDANAPITANDAQSVEAILVKPEKCGYLQDHVTVLHDETATKENIFVELDRLKERTSDSSTVLVFYSGHGDYDNHNEYYLTTHDTEVVDLKIKAGTGISELELFQKLSNYPTGRLLLLFNACYSGELSPEWGQNGSLTVFGDKTLPQNLGDALAYTGQGRVIITACRESQRSLYTSGPLTFFTQALVDGLENKEGANGYIDVYGLYKDIYDGVVSSATAFKRVQQPELTVIKGVGSLQRSAGPRQSVTSV